MHKQSTHLIRRAVPLFASFIVFSTPLLAEEWVEWHWQLVCQCSPLLQEPLSKEQGQQNVNNRLRCSRPCRRALAGKLPVPPCRDPLTLAISKDGLGFTHLFQLVGGWHVDYPHIIEHDDYLLIAFSGAKQTMEVLKVSLDDVDELIE